VLGITGTGGAGKSSWWMSWCAGSSSISHEDPRHCQRRPSKRKTGGALLGDRIRMNSHPQSRVHAFSSPHARATSR
jgi:methylmalonyl-CoA mutase